MQFEAAPMLEDIRLEGRPKDSKRIRAFDAAWARLQTDEPGWPLDPVDKKFHGSLISWLVFHRAILIGELVPEALKYLRGNPQCPDLSAFDHVIVDEYQDLNRADQVLLDTLTYDSAVIIGDENQSIYGFRYAHPAGINEYSSTHSNTSDHDLDECRRCPIRVVEMANQLILNNHLGSGTPKLSPMTGNPAGEVHIVQWKSMEEESLEVAAYIEWLLKQGQFKPGDILVLTPRKAIAYQIRDNLSLASVPAHSFYHEEILEDDAAQIVFVLLTLASDPEDRVALRFWLGYGSPSWRKGEYAKLREYCRQTGKSPTEVLKRQLGGESLVAGIAGLVGRFKELQGEIAKIGELKGQSLIDAVIPETQAELKHLRDSALIAVDDDMTAATLVGHMRAAVTQPEIPEDGDFVRIMSLQKSKGLTSKVVIICGLIEGFIPAHSKDVSELEAEQILQEQRRLFYVAVTRTTSVLVMSSFTGISTQLAYKTGAAFTGKFGKVKTVSSRFLHELGSSAPGARVGAVWKAGGYK